jgi:hypothetical protein
MPILPDIFNEMNRPVSAMDRQPMPATVAGGMAGRIHNAERPTFSGEKGDLDFIVEVGKEPIQRFE